MGRPLPPYRRATIGEHTSSPPQHRRRRRHRICFSLHLHGRQRERRARGMSSGSGAARARRERVRRSVAARFAAAPRLHEHRAPLHPISLLVVSGGTKGNRSSERHARMSSRDRAARARGAAASAAELAAASLRTNSQQAGSGRGCATTSICSSCRIHLQQLQIVDEEGRKGQYSHDFKPL